MDKSAIKTGTDVLRACVYTYVRKGHLGFLARDLGVGIGALEEFAYGRAQLPHEKLDLLAKEFFDANTSLDTETGLLKRKKRESTPVCTARPDPFDPSTVPPLKRYPDDYVFKPSRSVPTAPPRPGWAE